MRCLVTLCSKLLIIVVSDLPIHRFGWVHQQSIVGWKWHIWDHKHTVWAGSQTPCHTLQSFQCPSLNALPSDHTQWESPVRLRKRRKKPELSWWMSQLSTLMAAEMNSACITATFMRRSCKRVGRENLPDVWNCECKVGSFTLCKRGSVLRAMDNEWPGQLARNLVGKWLED